MRSAGRYLRLSAMQSAVRPKPVAAMLEAKRVIHLAVGRAVVCAIEDLAGSRVGLLVKVQACLPLHLVEEGGVALRSVWRERGSANAEAVYKRGRAQALRDQRPGKQAGRAAPRHSLRRAGFHAEATMRI